MAWLEKNAPRKAIANAMIDGTIELLGFFNPIPQNRSMGMGWIIKITSKRGMFWNVAVAISKFKPKYRAYTTKEVQWENYVGGNTLLFAGDNPEVYKELRNERPN